MNQSRAILSSLCGTFDTRRSGDHVPHGVKQVDRHFTTLAVIIASLGFKTEPLELRNIRTNLGLRDEEYDFIHRQCYTT